MTTEARVQAAGAAALALAIGFVAIGSGSAADDKDVRDAIFKIADALQNKDADGAKRQAQALAKANELDAVMDLFKLRTKKGVGIGETPNAIMPDGIEQKIINLAKKKLPQKQLDKEADSLVRAAYIAAAISEVARLKVPEKDDGMKKKKDWIDWSEGLSKSALDLADAAKSKNPDKVKSAATTVNSNCNNCHGVFRD